MKDIVEKYQYYFAETNRLRAKIEEQQNYLNELHEFFVELHEVDPVLCESLLKKVGLTLAGLAAAGGIAFGASNMMNTPKHDPLAGTPGYMAAPEPGSPRWHEMQKEKAERRAEREKLRELGQRALEGGETKTEVNPDGSVKQTTTGTMTIKGGKIQPNKPNKPKPSSPGAHSGMGVEGEI